MKKFGVLILLIFCFFTSSCIPPFLEGMVEIQDVFSSVLYQTYIIDYAEEQGYKLEEEQAGVMGDFVDGDDYNVLFNTYKKFDFICSSNTITITDIAFIMEAGATVEVEMLVTYNDTEVENLNLKLNQGETFTVEILDVSLKLQEGAKLTISIENPLELGEVCTRIDSFILIGE